MIETVIFGVLLGGLALQVVKANHDDKKRQEEWRREEERREKKWREERERERMRRTTPPAYTDGVSKDEFEEIVNDVVSKMPRIRSLTIEGLVIKIEVNSNSGLSDWSASIDFNDFGHLTGWYEVRTDNDQSPIPGTIAKRVKERIEARKTGLGND